MRLIDTLDFSLSAIKAARMRAVLMLLAMAIGVAAVVILTALGDGARRYVVNEFASLGTNLIIVLPGRSETSGGGLSMMAGGITRDLTINDALALTKHPAVVRIAPINVGVAPISWQNREREIPILGSTSELLKIRHWKLARGHFLPEADAELSSPVVVIGAKVSRELFGNISPLGEWVRIGERRFRVIGELASEGRSIGVDVEDTVIIPVASAQTLFNTESLFRILVEARSNESIPAVKSFVTRTLKERHQGEEDVTVITQDAVLTTFNKVLSALTFGVAGIAGISLSVAGILIMNVMLVSVAQRTSEVGLLKALGATARQIQTLFLVEAAILSLIGASIGLVLGYATNQLIVYSYPALPAETPLWALIAAILVSLITGLIFGVMPARRASRLDPVLALSKR